MGQWKAAPYRPGWVRSDCISSSIPIVPFAQSGAWHIRVSSGIMSNLARMPLPILLISAVPSLDLLCLFDTILIIAPWDAATAD